MERVKEAEIQPVLLKRPRLAPEQPEPSLVYSQPSLPLSIQGHGSIPSSFSHPLYFLFSSQPLVPTDHRKKMKGAKGALCLPLPLPAYFSVFTLVVWPCLSLSFYFCPLLPGGHVYPFSKSANTVSYACTFTHLHYARMICLMQTHFPHMRFHSASLLTLFWENTFRVA